MIDGCTPIHTYFQVVLPIMKPTCITVAILDAMWIWNDYLLPYLVLDMKPEQGSLQEQLYAVRRFLTMQKRYDGSRLR